LYLCLAIFLRRFFTTLPMTSPLSIGPGDPHCGCPPGGLRWRLPRRSEHPHSPSGASGGGAPSIPSRRIWNFSNRYWSVL
jgi:hypothetical protein